TVLPLTCSKARAVTPSCLAYPLHTPWHSHCFKQGWERSHTLAPRSGGFNVEIRHSVIPISAHFIDCHAFGRHPYLHFHNPPFPYVDPEEEHDCSKSVERKPGDKSFEGDVVTKLSGEAEA